MYLNFENIDFDPGAVSDLGLAPAPPAQAPAAQPPVAGAPPPVAPGPSGDPLRDTPGVSLEGFDFSTLPGFDSEPGTFGGILSQDGPYFVGEDGLPSGVDSGLGRFRFGGGQTGGVYDAEGYNELGINSGGLTRAEQAMVDEFMASRQDGWDFDDPFSGVFGGDSPVSIIGGGNLPGMPGGFPVLPTTPWETVKNLDPGPPNTGPSGVGTNYDWSPPVSAPSDNPFERPPPDAEGGIASLPGKG
tara:strand:+ start:4512 stop:5243 length:732 start_codon:yes stop_codon:yes gene_type:complete